MYDNTKKEGTNFQCGRKGSPSHKKGPYTMTMYGP